MLALSKEIKLLVTGGVMHLSRQKYQSVDAENRVNFNGLKNRQSPLGYLVQTYRGEKITLDREDIDKVINQYFWHLPQDEKEILRDLERFHDYVRQEDRWHMAQKIIAAGIHPQLDFLTWIKLGATITKWRDVPTGSAK